MFFFSEQNSIPKILKESSFPENKVTSLSKWTSYTYQKFCQAAFTHSLVDEDIPLPSDFYYSATFERGGGRLIFWFIGK